MHILRCTHCFPRLGSCLTSYSLLSCLSLLSLYHRASADSTFTSTTIDAASAAASSAATDPSDKMTPGELTILSSDGGELKEILSVGGNTLRGIIFSDDSTQDYDFGKKSDKCVQGFYSNCCCKSCLLLYDEIDFIFDNILLLCDNIFQLAFSVFILKGLAIVANREKMPLLFPMKNVVVLRNSTNCTEVESSCLLAVFEKIIGWC